MVDIISIGSGCICILLGTIILTLTGGLLSVPSGGVFLLHILLATILLTLAGGFLSVPSSGGFSLPVSLAVNDARAGRLLILAGSRPRAPHISGQPNERCLRR